MSPIRRVLTVLLCLALAGQGAAWRVAASCAVATAPGAGLAHAHHAASDQATHDEGPADPCAACTAGLDCHCSAPALPHAAVLVSPSLPPVPATAGDRPQLTGVRGGAIWRPPTFC